MPSADPLPSHPKHNSGIPPFPSPSTFSILPDLYILLSRLAPLQAAAQTLPPSSVQNGTTSSTTDATLYPTLSNEPPLQTLDIATAFYPIRQKVQKAVAAVRGMADVERSVEMQEEEIRLLEGRCRELKGRLGELGKIAMKGSGEKLRDTVMEGVEGD